MSFDQPSWMVFRLGVVDRNRVGGLDHPQTLSNLVPFREFLPNR
jgi:hypothetical protein